MDSQPLQNPSQSSATQPAAQPPINQMPVGPRKSRKKIILLGIILILIIVIVPIAVSYGRSYYEYLKIQQTVKQVENDRKNPLKVAAFKQSDLDRSNWKTFKGEFVGISFQYPQTWYEKENENVSQAPLTEVFGDNFQEYATDKKIGNTVWVKRYSQELDSEGYSNALKYLEKLKTTPKNKITVDLEYEDNYIEKLDEGKIKGDQEYLTFLKYSWDYKSIRDPNAEEGEREIDWKILITYIKSKDTIYEITFGYYDDEGANIYTNILKTAVITTTKIPNKKFENNIFSFEYSPLFNLRENVWPNFPVGSRDVRLMLEPVDSESDLLPIVIRSIYLDPNKYKTGSFKNSGSWWNEAICRYLGEPFWYDGFSLTNGYIDLFSNQDDSRGVGYDEYIVNKPYIVKLYSESQTSAKLIKEIVSTLKFKITKEVLDNKMADYLKDKTKSSQDIGLKCDGSTFFVQ